MSEERKLIFEAEVVGEGQIKVTLLNKNITLLSTASRLVSLEIDNLIIGQMNKNKPKIVQMPPGFIKKLRS